MLKTHTSKLKTNTHMKSRFLFTVTAILLFATEFVMAQPPGLPATPDQAPIDGGLSLLAAAGGVYAWKKLKSRNSEEI